MLLEFVGRKATLPKIVQRRRSVPYALVQFRGRQRRVAAWAKANVQEQRLTAVQSRVSTGATALIEALRSLDLAGIHPLDVSLKRPSLDDVFLSLTGHAAEEKKEEEVETKGRRKKAKK